MRMSLKSLFLLRQPWVMRLSSHSSSRILTRIRFRSKKPHLFRMAMTTTTMTRTH